MSAHEMTLAIQQAVLELQGISADRMSQTLVELVGCQLSRPSTRREAYINPALLDSWLSATICKLSWTHTAVHKELLKFGPAFGGAETESNQLGLGTMYRQEEGRTTLQTVIFRLTLLLHAVIDNNAMLVNNVFLALRV